MTRRLRPALEIVSDIGSLGFDLQHHKQSDIYEAVATLRTVNPDMFNWLALLLAGPGREDRTEVAPQEPSR